MKIEKKIEERILFLKKKHEKEEEENYNTITIKKDSSKTINRSFSTFPVRS
jgi:low affinity Fe/Cu permease